ncbi:thymocyte nuclear protein 1-like [Ctenocephalides felis]|uniref:thymocyte nuclear protein 1-like n=1 Tax=Ctenocephalides felis TaxID=7515 RepID=UPI000E6E52C1|nr:thymocyte nuclear protein 1-like [Ctenocephalides felis]XP_026469514.1 thymocyte nuclear protein 1-like [Ctenocephalides felis]
MPSYWMLKSEPNTYSFKQMETDQITSWDGVRNYQAQNFMKTMKIGDQAFFYHSVSDKEIVGIVEIIKEHYMADDPKFGMVDVKFIKPLKNPVTLAMLKSNPQLKDLLMLKQSRLSVSPVSESCWLEIMKMSKDS